MSVIVTEMDMPETCYSCKFCQEDDQLRDYCGITYDAIWYGEKERLKDCPLKSVDGLIQKMKFFAKRQEEIALAINDENKRYAHIQVANAYHHCGQVIKEYCEVSE